MLVRIGERKTLTLTLSQREREPRFELEAVRR
jgi:hypothetical protein